LDEIWPENVIIYSGK